MKLQHFRMKTLAFAVLLLSASVHSAPRRNISQVRDCAEAYKYTLKASGVFTIYPSVTPVKVYCDMDTDGGKWTVIQRRMDGTVNFYRPWEQYKAGFGTGGGEYWLGLEAIHLLTLKRKHQLRVDMEDFEGQRVYAQYSSFIVWSETEGYKMHVGSFTGGGAGDSLKTHNGMKFSTFDKDQDTSPKHNVAASYNGAFWYTGGHQANINGAYLWGPTKSYANGVNWSTWKGYHYSLKAVSMKIRPV